MGLGNQISRAFRKIGQKVQNLSTNRGANKIAKGAVVAYDKAKDFVRTILELNEKAIRFGNTVIDKSGQAANVLRQASGIANSITSGLAALGGDILVVGSVLKQVHQLQIYWRKVHKELMKLEIMQQEN